ncbi:SelB C-terminal domain-containing protein [Phenylobacterium sp.]|uniref:selenocysteine-specific translation elongation factor n=1 Tax=Phenylobacterium sp. TaxID=1871053 RepID=UPI0037C94854
MNRPAGALLSNLLIVASPRETHIPTAPLTLGVIGHVNHGKTALVRAMTGIETDRLPEELARGLSITPGFAWRGYPSGEIDVIDSPGHEDFIRAMVAGMTGVRAVLLVVSATEGFGRQTREHLQIAALLGLRVGLVAVTKADLASPDLQAERREDIQATLAGTFLAGAPVVFCSALTGQGLDQLHAAIDALRSTAPPPTALPGAFLPIDRAFTVPGAGVVVTGVLQGQPLTPDMRLVLEPSGRSVSLRQVQVHGRTVEAAPPGGRVAVGLRGVALDEVRAGDVLCSPGHFTATSQIDVRLTLDASAPRPLKHLDQVRVMWGARQEVASVRLMGASAIAPGADDFAQLRFASPVIAYAGQRGVLRRLSPAATIGGAIVLDPDPPVYRGRPGLRRVVLEAATTGDIHEIAGQLAARDGGTLAMAELTRLARCDAPAAQLNLALEYQDLGDGRFASRDALATARTAYLDLLAAAHQAAPTRRMVSTADIRGALARQTARDIVSAVERALAAEGAIRLEAGRVALSGHDPLAALSPEALNQLDDLEVALREGGLTPPDPARLTGGDPGLSDLLQLLIEGGRAISLRNVSLRQTLVFHPASLDEAVATLGSAFPPPLTFTTGEARAALGTSRKFIVPVLEYLDEMGRTTREGDVRRVVEA